VSGDIGGTPPADSGRDPRLAMGRLIISENVTLDGVIEAPAGVEA
jgi:hypothetical protein